MAKIELYFLGGKNDKQYENLINEYIARTQKWIDIVCYTSTIKNTDPPRPLLYQQKECEWILKKINPSDMVILCDERGKMMNNTDLSKYIERTLSQSKKLVFIVGSAYGVDEVLKKRAHLLWSFSPLVFPHQLARLMIAEQLYRSFSIIHHLPYHHE